jgi:hypothetical protein
MARYGKTWPGNGQTVRRKRPLRIAVLARDGVSALALGPRVREVGVRRLSDAAFGVLEPLSGGAMVVGQALTSAA